MMRKTLTRCVIASLLILLVSSVALSAEIFKAYTVYGEEEEAAFAKAGHKYFLAMSQSTMNHPWRLACTDSFLKAAEKYKLKRFVWTDGSNDAANQLGDIEDLIAMKPDAIMLTALVEQALTPAARKCKTAGIPLIVFDREIAATPGVDYVTFIGIDSVELGRSLGRMTANKLYEKYGEYRGNVALLRGTLGASVFEDRKKGFYEILTKYPNIKVIAEQSGDCLREPGMRVTEDWLQRFPRGKIDMIASENDEMALGALQAVKDAGRQDLIGYIAALDGQKDALEKVVSGEFAGTAQCPPYYGDITIATTIKYLETRNVPPKVQLPFNVYDTKEKAAAMLDFMNKYNLMY